MHTHISRAQHTQKATGSFNHQNAELTLRPHVGLGSSPGKLHAPGTEHGWVDLLHTATHRPDIQNHQLCSTSPAPGNSVLSPGHVCSMVRTIVMPASPTHVKPRSSCSAAGLLVCTCLYQTYCGKYLAEFAKGTISVLGLPTTSLNDFGQPLRHALVQLANECFGHSHHLIQHCLLELIKGIAP